MLWPGSKGDGKGEGKGKEWNSEGGNDDPTAQGVSDTADTAAGVSDASETAGHDDTAAGKAEGKGFNFFGGLTNGHDDTAAGKAEGKGFDFGGPLTGNGKGKGERSAAHFALRFMPY